MATRHSQLPHMDDKVADILPVCMYYLINLGFVIAALQTLAEIFEYSCNKHPELIVSRYE
jgi:hypothetical protein